MGSEPQYPRGVVAWPGSCSCLSYFAMYCVLANNFPLLNRVWGELRCWKCDDSQLCHLSPIILSCHFPISKSARRNRSHVESCFSLWRIIFMRLTAVEDVVGKLQLLCWSWVYTVVEQSVVDPHMCVLVYEQIHLHTQAFINVCMLAQVFLCMYVCVCTGQRSESYPRITEGLKTPRPPCWSCRATVYRTTASHCSPMDRCYRVWTD